MQLVSDSITLGKWLFDRDINNLTVNETLNMKILIQILHGLRHIHKHGYVHRDIKPDNVFVCKNGRTLIGDFGLAKELNENPLVEVATAINTIITGVPTKFGIASQHPPSDNHTNNNNDKMGPTMRQYETTRSHGSKSVENVKVVADHALFGEELVKSTEDMSKISAYLTTGLGSYFYASPEQGTEGHQTFHTILTELLQHRCCCGSCVGREERIG
jgi:serine/threonine protein kinase